MPRRGARFASAARPARNGSASHGASAPASSRNERRREREHPGVPVVAAAFEVAAGALGVGLLVEAAHGEALAEPLAGFDVAVAGLGPVGPHPEDHEASLGGERGGAGDRGGKALLRLDDVVGGQHEQRRVRLAAGLEPGAGVGDRGRRVARGRFGEDREAGRPQPARLLQDRLRLALVGDDEHAAGRPQAERARQRLLEERSAAAEVQELLRRAFARCRPQPGARAARQDHDVLDHRPNVTRGVLRINPRGAPRPPPPSRLRRRSRAAAFSLC